MWEFVSGKIYFSTSHPWLDMLHLFQERVSCTLCMILHVSLGESILGFYQVLAPLWKHAFYFLLCIKRRGKLSPRLENFFVVVIFKSCKRVILNFDFKLRNPPALRKSCSQIPKVVNKLLIVLIEDKIFIYNIH